MIQISLIYPMLVLIVICFQLLLERAHFLAAIKITLIFATLACSYETAYGRLELGITAYGKLEWGIDI